STKGTSLFTKSLCAFCASFWHSTLFGLRREIGLSSGHDIFGMIANFNNNVSSLSVFCSVSRVVSDYVTLVDVAQNSRVDFVRLFGLLEIIGPTSSEGSDVVEGQLAAHPLRRIYSQPLFRRFFGRWTWATIQPRVRLLSIVPIE